MGGPGVKVDSLSVSRV